MSTEGQLEVKPHHRSRLAVVYVRQSTVRQACDLASLDSQRAQSAHARAWGWPESAIQVINEDVGLTGLADTRPGYQRLLTLVRQGQVGMLLVSDIARLTRSSVQFEALRQMCRATDTLLVVDGAIVDCNDPTDRFMVNLRAGVAEHENALREQALMRATWVKARNGHAVRRPPTGYVADRSGRWGIDPDPGVRKTISQVFTDFERLGTIGKVLEHYRKNGIGLPVRRVHQVRYTRASRGRIRAILTHPAFMGTYVFGRRVTGRGRICRPLNADEVIGVPGHHEPYVTPERWERIQAQFRRKSPPGR